VSSRSLPALAPVSPRRYLPRQLGTRHWRQPPTGACGFPGSAEHEAWQRHRCRCELRPVRQSTRVRQTREARLRGRSRSRSGREWRPGAGAGAAALLRHRRLAPAACTASTALDTRHTHNWVCPTRARQWAESKRARELPLSLVALTAPSVVEEQSRALQRTTPSAQLAAPPLQPGVRCLSVSLLGGACGRRELV